MNDLTLSNDVADVEESVTEVTPVQPNRKTPGRPRKALPAYDGPRLDVSSAQVVQIPINHLNLDDTTFQIRATTRPEILIDSIRNVGVLVPLIVRTHPSVPDQYQIISGFNRAQAALRAGMETVPVVVRELDDQQSFIFAFTDNERRKTLDDLDRANAMRKLRESGHARTTADVAGMFRISERQVQRLEGLLETPEALRRAIADPESGVSSTHALVLNQAMRNEGPSFPLDRWLNKIREQRLSVAALKKSLRGARVQAGRKQPAVVVNSNHILIDRKKLTRAAPEERHNLRILLLSLASELDASNAPDIDAGGTVEG